MTDGFAIVAGAPTDAEREAVRLAFLALRREDEAAQRTGPNAWVAAGRAEATGTGAAPLGRGPNAWRLSARFTGPESHIGIGRGDAR